MSNSDDQAAFIDDLTKASATPALKPPTKLDKMIKQILAAYNSDDYQTRFAELKAATNLPASYNPIYVKDLSEKVKEAKAIRSAKGDYLSNPRYQELMTDTINADGSISHGLRNVDRMAAAVIAQEFANLVSVAEELAELADKEDGKKSGNYQTKFNEAVDSLLVLPDFLNAIEEKQEQVVGTKTALYENIVHPLFEYFDFVYTTAAEDIFPENTYSTSSDTDKTKRLEQLRNVANYLGIGYKRAKDRLELINKAMDTPNALTPGEQRELEGKIKDLATDILNTELRLRIPDTQADLKLTAELTQALVFLRDSQELYESLANTGIQKYDLYTVSRIERDKRDDESELADTNAEINNIDTNLRTITNLKTRASALLANLQQVTTDARENIDRLTAASADEQSALNSASGDRTKTIQNDIASRNRDLASVKKNIKDPTQQQAAIDQLNSEIARLNEQLAKEPIETAARLQELKAQAQSAADTARNQGETRITAVQAQITALIDSAPINLQPASGPDAGRRGQAFKLNLDRAEQQANIGKSTYESKRQQLNSQIQAATSQLEKISGIRELGAKVTLRIEVMRLARARQLAEYSQALLPKLAEAELIHVKGKPKEMVDENMPAYIQRDPKDPIWRALESLYQANRKPGGGSGGDAKVMAMLDFWGDGSKWRAAITKIEVQIREPDTIPKSDPGDRHIFTSGDNLKGQLSTQAGVAKALVASDFYKRDSKGNYTLDRQKIESLIQAEGKGVTGITQRIYLPAGNLLEADSENYSMGRHTAFDRRTSIGKMRDFGRRCVEVSGSAIVTFGVPALLYKIGGGGQTSLYLSTSALTLNIAIARGAFRNPFALVINDYHPEIKSDGPEKQKNIVQKGLSRVADITSGTLKFAAGCFITAIRSYKNSRIAASKTFNTPTPEKAKSAKNWKKISIGLGLVAGAAAAVIAIATGHSPQTSLFWTSVGVTTAQVWSDFSNKPRKWFSGSLTVAGAVLGTSVLSSSLGVSKWAGMLVGAFVPSSVTRTEKVFGKVKVAAGWALLTLGIHGYQQSKEVTQSYQKNPNPYSPHPALITMDGYARHNANALQVAATWVEDKVKNMPTYIKNAWNSAGNGASVPTSTQPSIYGTPPAAAPAATPASIYGAPPVGPAVPAATPASIYGAPPVISPAATPASIYGAPPAASPSPATGHRRGGNHRTGPTPTPGYPFNEPHERIDANPKRLAQTEGREINSRSTNEAVEITIDQVIPGKSRRAVTRDPLSPVERLLTSGPRTTTIVLADGPKDSSETAKKGPTNIVSNLLNRVAANFESRTQPSAADPTRKGIA